jgi:hypothetical protein
VAGGSEVGPVEMGEGVAIADDDTTGNVDEGAGPKDQAGDGPERLGKDAPEVPTATDAVADGVAAVEPPGGRAVQPVNAAASRSVAIPRSTAVFPPYRSSCRFLSGRSCAA